MKSILFRLVSATALAGVAGSQVVISEIMYNPDSSEASPNHTEWIELYNATGGSIVLDGWTLSDEDGSTTIPAGTTIGAFEAIVLFSDGITESEFKAGWPGSYQAIPVSFSALSGLANSPSITNEILMIADTTPSIIDVVNFDDSGAWPSDSPDGPSIAVLECFLDATSNDDGNNWRRSMLGLRHGTSNTMTSTFNGVDIGSPGIVPVTAASAVFRNGTGVNPSSFTSVTLPIIGTTWTSTIDIVSAGAAASIIVVTAAPLTAPTSVGELLVDISMGILAQDIAIGVHSIGLAPDCTLAGLTLYAQGLTFAVGPVFQLENAIDLTFGSF